MPSRFGADGSGCQVVGGYDSVGTVTGFGGDRLAGIVTLHPDLGFLGLGRGTTTTTTTKQTRRQLLAQ